MHRKGGGRGEFEKVLERKLLNQRVAARKVDPDPEKTAAG